VNLLIGIAPGHAEYRRHQHLPILSHQVGRVVDHEFVRRAIWCQFFSVPPIGTMTSLS
jgi:hypothetical protein